MDEDTRDVGGTPSESATQPSALDEAVSEIVSESREDVEQSVRDEGRDDAAAIINAVRGMLDELFGSVDARLSAIERAQRDSFATMVRDGGVVRDRTMVEVDHASAPASEDYDLSI